MFVRRSWEVLFSPFLGLKPPWAPPATLGTTLCPNAWHPSHYCFLTDAAPSLSPADILESTGSEILSCSSGDPQTKAWTRISPGGLNTGSHCCLMPDWKFKSMDTELLFSNEIFFFIKLHVGFLQLSLWVQNVQSFGCLKVIISWDEVHCTEMSSVLELEEEPLNLGASCQVLTWCLDCQRREAGERSGERSWNLCLYLCSVE